MSGSEIQVLKLGDDPYTMTVEGYDGEGYYSSFWRADTDYTVLLEFTDHHRPSEDAKAIVQSPSSPKSRVDYEVLDKYLPTDTELLRIDDHGYALTWQQLEAEMNRVGFISTESNIDLLTDLYNESTGLELSEPDCLELGEFVSKF